MIDWNKECGIDDAVQTRDSIRAELHNECVVGANYVGYERLYESGRHHIEVKCVCEIAYA